MAFIEPTPPPEAQTEAEKTAYCAGWWDALEKARKAEPVATMTVREDIIRMAREVGLKVCTNISGVTLVGAPLGDTPSIAHITIDEMARFTALVVAAERERNAKIADAHASCEGIAQVIAAEIRGQA